MIRLNINGHDHEVDAEPDTPLLYVLRDDLRLNGAKFGCGLGQCGACTVMVDGQAVFSCLTPIVALPGRPDSHHRGPGQQRRSNAPSSTNRPPNAATASPAWSCAPWPCWNTIRIQPKRRSAEPWPSICAAAEPICASWRPCAGPLPPWVRPNGETMNATLSRRGLLALGGGLVIAFCLARRRTAPAPGSLKQTPFLDAWIRVAPDGHVTVFTGKVELGQGLKTAFLQVAAEQLDVCARRRSNWSPPTRPAHRTRASLPAAIPCRTAAPRS